MVYPFMNSRIFEFPVVSDYEENSDKYLQRGMCVNTGFLCLSKNLNSGIV